MNATDRAKFMSIETGDTVRYLDNEGATCQGLVSGWINHKGDPAPLVGKNGERHVPLAKVLSRTRHGATKEWPAPKS